MSDRDIRVALQRLENPLIVDPGFDPQRLQPASLELTLGAEYLIDGGSTMNAAGQVIGYGMVEGSMVDRGHVTIYPQDFMLATTVERVCIPTDLVAQVNGKSSLARQGLIVHTTAGFIDPGFRGQITLELKNLSRRPITLLPGMPICQLVFFQMTSPSERPYGSKGLSSHYQGQVGPTRSAA